MTQITITAEPKQSFNYAIEDNIIEFVIEYLTTIQRWQMSIVYKDEKIVDGMLLSADTFQLDTYQLPFDIFVSDNQTLGLAPFDLNSFELGYYSFIILDNADMKGFRGFEVQL